MKSIGRAPNRLPDHPAMHSVLLRQSPDRLSGRVAAPDPYRSCAAVWGTCGCETHKESTSPAGADVHGSGVLRVWTTIRNQPLNADPAAPRFFDADAMSQAGSPGLEFAGLAPGLVGLYQLNVRVPETFDVVLPCGGEVRSNALVLVTTTKGSEVVSFCVER